MYFFKLYHHKYCIKPFRNENSSKSVSVSHQKCSPSASVSLWCNYIAGMNVPQFCQKVYLTFNSRFYKMCIINIAKQKQVFSFPLFFTLSLSLCISLAKLGSSLISAHCNTHSHTNILSHWKMHVVGLETGKHLTKSEPTNMSDYYSTENQIRLCFLLILMDFLQTWNLTVRTQKMFAVLILGKPLNWKVRPEPAGRASLCDHSVWSTGKMERALCKASVSA